MLERYFRRPRVLARLRASVLAESLEPYVSRLAGRGHPVSTVQVYVQAVEHFGVWLRNEGIPVGAVGPDAVSEFVDDHLPICTCPTPHPRHAATVRAALHHLVRILGEGRPNICTKPAPAEEEVAAFSAYLTRTCGVAAATRLYRERYVREFLTFRFGGEPAELGVLRLKDVIAFVTHRAATLKPSSLRVLASALRSYLRFGRLRGLCDPHLAEAVPMIRQWKLAGLPRTMTEQQVRGLVQSFDLTTPTGQRDHAMALCMLEMGLRASEVGLLSLQDIDWRQGTVRVAGSKTQRERLLPLPHKIGRAISRYLRQGRPASGERRVFVRHSVPVGIGLNTGQVRGAMRRAYARAKLPAEWTGTHLLRHTAATRMHQRGAQLKEIADILGHASIDSTAIYIKVDAPALSSVALPWPEDAR